VPFEYFGVIPFARLTPANCRFHADAGRAAIARLTEWGLNRILRSNLSDAVRTLDAVVSRDSYGATNEELERTLRAIHLCADFYQVAASLGDKPIIGAAPELALSLQGGLSGTRSERQAREYLSQYWFGSVLTRVRVSPCVLADPAAPSRPDFLIDLGGFDCTIEVKRPESINSARDALDRAAGQLRSYGKPGIACIDLTDCICLPGFATAFLSSPAPIGDVVWRLFWNISQPLCDRPVKYNQSDKYARVFALVLFARVAGWRGVNDPQPEARYFIQVATYPSACAGLVSEYGARFSRLVRTGFQEVSGSDGRLL